MPKLILHGGAGTIQPERQATYRAGLQAALNAGWGVLAQGGGAMDACLRAVEVMEANPDAFNAGVGGSPNRDGQVELDACVMDGRDGSAGAVASVRNTPSAVRLADRVRTSTPHVLLVGVGAEALEPNPIDPQTLLTPYTRASWERWRAGQTSEDATPKQPTGSATVGAVALDAAGHVAAATSTGGMLGKWPGRVGDAPIVGAGTYADMRVGVSCTGKGEAFLRAVTAKALAERIAAGQALEPLLTRAIDEVHAFGGEGGLITITASGHIGYAFDTPQLAVAWRDDTEQAFDVLTGGRTFVR
jgi:beta-aspartyl-peptidase (threonine type)